MHYSIRIVSQADSDTENYECCKVCFGKKIFSKTLVQIENIQNMDHKPCGHPIWLTS